MTWSPDAARAREAFRANIDGSGHTGSRRAATDDRAASQQRPPLYPQPPTDGGGQQWVPWSPPASQQQYAPAPQQGHYPPSDTSQPWSDPYQPAPERLQPPAPLPPTIGPPPDDVDHSSAEQEFALERLRREGPQQGWRRTLHRLNIPIGKSSTEQTYDQDVVRINKRLRHPKVVGVASLKGGVGKTSLAISIASTMAQLRRQGEVAALDTDHLGTMALRTKGEQPSDVKSFAADYELNSVNDVKAHMMTNQDRLSVLASSRSLAAAASPLQSEEYTRAVNVLKRNHLIVVVDMDTSAASPAYETIMQSLDALVVVTATAFDSAVASKEMMHWLRARGLNELATRTIILMNHQSPAKPYLNVEQTESHFKNNEGRKVLTVPWDEHLAESGPIVLDLLNKSTRREFVKVAALIVDQLPAT